MPHHFLRDLSAVKTHTRGYLPHWELPSATYSLTFRLYGSLPRIILAPLLDRIHLLKEAKHLAFREELEREIDRALDQHHGTAFMNEERIATIVANTLTHFDSERYDLHAWCVMPNHVHAVVRPFEGFPLWKIVQSWKQHSAMCANELLGRSGRFWQREYFDRIVRDDDDLRRTVEYVLANPVKARLRNWPFTSADWKSADRPTGSRRSD